MTLPELDWHYLRDGLVGPAITAGLAVALLAGSLWLHEAQREVVRQLSINQDAMHEDHDDLVERRRLVDQYHRRYQALHEQGFVGLESRLDWIESLRTAAESLTLTHVSYVIEPQNDVVAPVQSILHGEDIGIHVSRMGLEMELLHELDLLRLIDELQRTAPGLIKVDSCALEWQQERAAGLSGDANLSASCTLYIFSVITSDVDAGGPA